MEEDYERLDTAEILNMTMLLEKNKDKKQKQMTKEMLIECPELNF